MGGVLLWEILTLSISILTTWVLITREHNATIKLMQNVNIEVLYLTITLNISSAEFKLLQGSVFAFHGN